MLFITPAMYRELQNKIEKKKEILSSARAQWMVYQIDQVAISLTPKERIISGVRDKDDNKILECAVAAKADLIITMDKDLLKLKHFRAIGIVHPKTFFYMFPEIIH